MIKALETTTAGLLKAQARATELASDILENTAGPQPTREVNSDGINVVSGIRTNTMTQSNSLIHQLSEYKLAKIQFHSSASVFKRITVNSDTTLGLLLDKKE